MTGISLNNQRGQNHGLNNPIFGVPNSEVRFNFPNPDLLDPDLSILIRSTLPISAEKSFKGLKQVKDKTIGIYNELLSYAAGLPEKFNMIRSSSTYSEGKLNRLFSHLSEDDLKAIFPTIIDRLRKETAFLKELEDHGIAEALAEGCLTKGDYGAFVKFYEDPETFGARLFLPKDVAGCYRPVFDFITVRGAAPSQRDIVRSLLRDGGLPREVSVLDHELVHNSQHGVFSRICSFGLLGGNLASNFLALKFLGLAGIATLPLISRATRAGYAAIGNETILQEAHAYEAQSSSPAAIMPENDEMHEIVSHIAAHYAVDASQINQTMIAYTMVRSLRLFGFNDNEIGKLVDSDKFDKATKTYPKLLEALDKRRQEYGIMDTSDYKLILSALDARHEIEKYVQRVYAARIAREEIRDLFKAKRGAK